MIGRICSIGWSVISSAVHPFLHSSSDELSSIERVGVLSNDLVFAVFRMIAANVRDTAHCPMNSPLFSALLVNVTLSLRANSDRTTHAHNSEAASLERKQPLLELFSVPVIHPPFSALFSQSRMVNEWAARMNAATPLKKLCPLLSMVFFSLPIPALFIPSGLSKAFFQPHISTQKLACIA